MGARAPATAPLSALRPNEWLGVLVKLTAPMDAVKAAEGALGMAPALAIIPGHKMTEESAVYVASKVKKMPNFGTICALLDEWWDLNRPKPETLALAAPDDSPHAEQEKREDENRKSWQSPSAVRESLATVNSMGDRHPLRDVCGKMLGKAVWKYAPQNLGLIPPEWHPTKESVGNVGS